MIPILTQKININNNIFKNKATIQENKKASANCAEKNSPIPANIYKANFVPFLGLNSIDLPTPQSFQDFTAKFEKLNISVKNFIKETLREKDKLGEGSQGIAYNFPIIFGMQDYVLKIGNNSLPYDTLDRTFFKKIKDPAPSLNIGQAVAEVEKDKSYKILKKVNGVEVTANSSSSKTESQKKNQYLNGIKILAQMPQKAYDELINTVIKINRLGIELDDAGGNLLADLKTNTLNPIDTFSRGTGETYTEIGDLLNFIIVNPSNYVKNSADLADYQKSYKKVVHKFLLAFNKPESQVPFELCAGDLDLKIKGLNYNDIKQKLSRARTTNEFESFKQYLDKFFDGETQSLNT